MHEFEVDITPAVFASGTAIHRERKWTDFDLYGDVLMQLDWEARLQLASPRTLTQGELTLLVHRFSEEHLRSKCMRIVLSMPEELLPVVCPQLEETVDYEWKMLRERQAERRHPAIRESWGAIPAPA